MVNSDADELHAALMDVIAWSMDERGKRGEKALELLRACYSWDVVAPKYDRFYRQVLEGNL